MYYKYFESFNKTEIDNIEAVEAVLAKTNLNIDPKWHPLIDESEAGNTHAQAELFDMFTFGIHGMQLDLNLAKHFFSRITEDQEDTPELEAERLIQYAIMCKQFQLEEELEEAYMSAFKSMVANFDPSEWNKEIFKTISKALGF